MLGKIRIARMASILLVLATVLLTACTVASSSPTPSSPPAASHPIAFMTDYGTKDFYVGAVKGVMRSINPNLQVFDITHEITSYDIHEGGVTLLLAARTWPNDTIFLAVVDPGVGTERRPIVAQTMDGKLFIGPDNGLFTLVLQEFGAKEVRQITNEAWMRPGQRSDDFHGRDVFGPVAAWLSLGKPFVEVGPVIADYVTLPIGVSRQEGRQLIGEVLWIDTFGDMQVNITSAQAKQAGWVIGDQISARVGTASPFVAPFVNTYGDVPEGSSLIFQASTDFLELSINMGNMKEALNAEIGAPVTLEKAP